MKSRHTLKPLVFGCKEFMRCESIGKHSLLLQLFKCPIDASQFEGMREAVLSGLCERQC